MHFIKITDSKLLYDQKVLERKIKDEAIDKKNQVEEKALVEIFQRFSEFEVPDERHLVNLIPPTNVDYKTGDLSLDLNQAFLKYYQKKITEN